MIKLRNCAGSVMFFVLLFPLLSMSHLNAAKLQKAVKHNYTAGPVLSSLLTPLMATNAKQDTDLSEAFFTRVKTVFARMLEEFDHSGNSYIVVPETDKDKNYTPAIKTRLRDGVPTIVAIAPGSDGWRKNVMAGDMILEVNGYSCAGSLIADINNMLKGSKDSTVKLKLLRRSADKVYKVTLKREEVEGKLYIKTLVDQLLYIKPTCLNEKIVKQIPSSLPKTEKKLIGVILDLRGTTGGGIVEAKALSRLFIKKGVLVKVVKKPSKSGIAPSVKEYKVDNPKATSARLVILVDEGTGKAAEIVAATLKEQHRAVVMGESTCGLGAIYHTINSGHYGTVHLPESLLSTPGGTSLFNKGILPDIPAEYGKVGVREWGKFRHEVLALLNDVKPEDLEWPGKKKEAKTDDSGALIDELTKDSDTEEASDTSEEKQDDESENIDPKLKASVEEQILENYPLVRKYDRPFVRALNLLISMNVFFSETGR